MSDPSFERWEAELRRQAQAFPYPDTPDLAGQMRDRLARPTGQRSRPKWGWVVAIALILMILGGLLTVPQVRAGVVNMLRLGAVRIFLTEPTPTSIQISPTPLPKSPILQPTSTPANGHLESTAAETMTLEAVAAWLDFPLHLPTYPADLGQPDDILVENIGGPVVVLIWLVAGRPDQPRLMLYQMGTSPVVTKFNPLVITETVVHGQPAIWAEGPYMVQFLQPGHPVSSRTRRVTGQVLVWTEEEMTYRLEGQFSLAEGVKIAESLRVWQGEE